MSIFTFTLLKIDTVKFHIDTVKLITIYFVGPVTIISPNSGSVVVGSPVIGSTNVGSIPEPLTLSTASTHVRNSHGCNSRCLVSKLFDVCSRSTLQEMEKKEEIRIPWGTGIVGYVAESGVPVNIPDAYKVSFLQVY